MTTNLPYRRRNYFIKKRFQARFSAYFLALIIVEAFLIGALLLYVSRGTLTTAYSQEGLRIEHTSSFFFVNFILISLIVGVAVGLSALAVFIYLTHRMAGPLYQLEKVMNEIAKGDLRYRIRLRKTDQFRELEAGLNDFIKTMDNNVDYIKRDVSSISKMLEQEKMDKDKLKEAFEKLEDKLEFFKTST